MVRETRIYNVVNCIFYDVSTRYLQGSAIFAVLWLFAINVLISPLVPLAQLAHLLPNWY